MKAADINSPVIDSYLQLLNNLSPSKRLDLISKLTLSVKSDIADRKRNFQNAFGSFESNKTTEEINKDIRNSRTFDREIESC